MLNEIQENFLNKLSSENTWITKSMEFNKTKTCGTLWYLKKYIVLYYYIFQTNKLLEQDNFKEINNIFISYIESIPFEYRDIDIKNFFLIENNGWLKQNKKSLKFFINDTIDKNHIILAKKLYFCYLMDLGGQNEINSSIKNLLFEDTSTFEDVFNHANLFKESPLKILNDFVSSLRNERQLFFFYGFFHGNASNNFNEFHKLTQIGKAVMGANFLELIIIWEHQKLKIVFPFPENNISSNENNYCAHPYFTYLSFLKKYKQINLNIFTYFISKLSDNYDINSLNYDEDFLQILKKEIDETASKSLKDDTRKELKKFNLGITNYTKDYNYNPFSFLKNDLNNTKEDIDYIKLSKIHRYYKEICEYLNDAYKQEYSNFKNSKELDDKNYLWSNFKINFDLVIIFNLILLAISLKQEFLIKTIDEENLRNELNSFKFLLKNILNIDIEYFIDRFKENKFKQKTKNIIIFSKLEDFFENVPFNRDDSFDSLKTLLNFSDDSINLNSITQKRNISLKTKIRNYCNIHEISNCECCKKNFFLKEDNSYYFELHHLIPFAKHNGPDHILNFFIICPECHRKFHYQRKKQRIELYKPLIKNSIFNQIFKNSDYIINRLEYFYEKNILEPIHLDFLFKEKIITEYQKDFFLTKSPIIEFKKY